MRRLSRPAWLRSRDGVRVWFTCDCGAECAVDLAMWTVERVTSRCSLCVLGRLIRLRHAARQVHPHPRRRR